MRDQERTFEVGDLSASLLDMAALLGRLARSTGERTAGYVDHSISLRIQQQSRWKTLGFCSQSAYALAIYTLIVVPPRLVPRPDTILE
jgi:hypothetical protein